MNHRPFLTIVAALLLGTVATFASAQSTYWCPNCNAYHTRQAVTQAVPSGGNDALALANRQRAARGLGPLSHDPNLIQGATIKVNEAARRGVRGHLGGSLYGARREGVGWSSSRTASACYLYTLPAGSPVGIAMAQGRGGLWYTCLLSSASGSYPAKPGGLRGGGRRIRIFRR